MEHKEHDFRKICFYCATIYATEDKEILICPVCHKSISISEYERIMGSVRQSVFQGWTCRIEYESNEDEEKLYYTEQCGEILNFVALAIASGLIGKISSDIYDKVIDKIKSYLAKNKMNNEDNVLSDFLNSSEKIKRFSEYISAYYEEYEAVDDKTKNAIMEEVFVDKVSYIIDGLIKMKHKEIDIEKVMEDSPHTKEEIMKMVLEIQKKVNVEKLKKEDFKNFWDNIKSE